jgi:uncharacterized protein (DUF433 family)
VDGRIFDLLLAAKCPSPLFSLGALPLMENLLDSKRGSVPMFARITFNPNLMGGRACIRGMRITVSLVVNLVANGMSADEIVREYPDLEPEDIREALSYASALASEEVNPFSSPAA